MRVETILSGLSVEEIASQAIKAETLGYDGAITTETGHDPFLPLLIAAEHTKRISLATGIAIAFPRSPFVVAQMAWDLQRFSGGRFLLGLGTQVKGHNERRYATLWTAPPVPRLREYILCLRSIFQTFQSGDRPTYKGQYYQFTLIPPVFNPGPIRHPRIPIFISAVNKFMARLAGELCEGVRLHPMNTAKYSKEVLLPNIEAGATKAGRSLSQIDIAGAPFIITGKNDEEIEKTKGPIRQQIAFYASTRSYLPVLAAHGWEETGRQLYRLSLEGKWVEMAGLISDEMLEEFATIGTYKEIVPKLKERWGDFITSVILYSPPDSSDRDERLKAMIQELHEL